MFWVMTLKMVVAGFFETSVNNYQLTRRHIPVDCNLQRYHYFLSLQRLVWIRLPVCYGYQVSSFPVVAMDTGRRQKGLALRAFSDFNCIKFLKADCRCHNKHRHFPVRLQASAASV